MVYEYTELKNILKIGDIVMRAKGKHNPCAQIPDDCSKTGMITDIRNDTFWINGCSHMFTDKGSFLELITKNNATESSTVKLFMNKVLTFVKNATLSSTDKLLRKHGLQDDCGNVTEDAKAAILLNFYNNADNQAYLLTIANGLEAEDVAAK